MGHRQITSVRGQAAVATERRLCNQRITGSVINEKKPALLSRRRWHKQWSTMSSFEDYAIDDKDENEI